MKLLFRHVMSKDSDLSVLYGADLHTGDHGSGFPVLSASKRRKLNSETTEEDILKEDIKEYELSGWNLNNLPHLTSSLLRHIGNDVSGMTRPWVYIGMCFAGKIILN